MKDKRLGIIFLTVFMDLVGFGIIIPLNSYFARVYGATPLQVGLLMSVYSLMQFIFSPIWGHLSDRFGRRPIILVSLLGSALAHTGFGLAHTFEGLVLARALAGLFGGNISTAMAYIADITDEKNRSKGMGMVGAAFGLGFMLGPVIGGVFAEHSPAFIAGGICFANFLGACWYLPESRAPGAKLAKRESRWRRISNVLTTPVLGSVMVLVFLNTFAMANIEASLFLYVQDLFHWPLSKASYGFAYIGVILVFTQGYLVRKWMPKLGERKMLLGGLVLSACGFGLIALAHSIPLLACAVTLLGVGNGLVNPSLNGSASLLSGKDVQGHNLGVSQSFSSMARIVGPAAGGALYYHLGMWTPFATASSVAVIGALMVWRLGAKLPEGGKAHG